MDWLDLFESMGPQFHDVEQLKKDLAIAYVLDTYGVQYYSESGKLRAKCPFHDDQNPSFDVYGETLSRWGCLACGKGGDVLDLVNEFDKIEKFVHLKDRCGDLYREQRRSGWAGPRAGVKRRYDAEAGSQLVLASESAGSGPWLKLHQLLGKNVRAVDPEVIRLDYRLGSQADETIIPYYNRDLDLIAYKRRRPGGKAMAAPGADFSDVLYAEWLDDGRGPVLLCEGESDVWAAGPALPDWNVMGIPTGVLSNPVQASRLKGREVVLAFDGDSAGRSGLLRWYAVLEPLAKSVRVVVMPDDADIAEIDDIEEAVNGAVSVPPIPERISAMADGLYRNPKSEKTEPEALSNWAILPERQLVGDGLDAWEAVLSPSNRSAVITTHDLAGKRQLVDWSSRHGGSWYGSDTDCQHLQAWLQAIQPFLAAGFTTQIAGLHNNHFVYPGGSIGPDHWVYAAGKQDVELHRYLGHLTDEGQWDAELFIKQIRAMRALHNPSVMDPIMSWLALAPLRSLINPFPALAVLGGSGSGKTTLLETVLRAFTGSEIGINLASTTRFAIQAMVASTNSFPVWFDEYRPGAAQDAITALDQIIRDSYNGHGSIKGGMGDHWAQVRMLKAEAPLVISGEDAFTETSHLERLVTVYLPQEGRSSQALNFVQSWGPTLFPHRWMEILRYGLLNEDFSLEVTPADEPNLAPRMNYNLGVLRLGWSILELYTERISGAFLGEPDFSRVIETWQMDNAGNPILDALRWVQSEPDASAFRVEADGMMHVKPRNFVNFVKKAGFLLPGQEKAVRRYMVEELGGVESRVSIMGSQARTIAIPLSELE
jgi:hypothetical protein